MKPRGLPDYGARGDGGIGVIRDPSCGSRATRDWDRGRCIFSSAPPFGKVAHCLDQHPDIDIQRARKLRIAGDSLRWHHNTLVLHGGSTDPNSTVGMRIRGTPRSLARVYNNWFQTTDVWQALGLSFSNVWIYNNVYGPEKRGLAEITTRTTPQIWVIAKNVQHDTAPGSS